MTTASMTSGRFNVSKHTDRHQTTGETDSTTVTVADVSIPHPVMDGTAEQVSEPTFSAAL